MTENTRADSGPDRSSRSGRKAARRAELLRAAAVIMARDGYTGMRLDDLGAAAGISGPAVYRYFPNKEGVLVELLVGISDQLLARGQEVIDAALPRDRTLAELIDRHLDFSMGEPELIRIQDRDMAHLPEQDRARVARTQLEYIDLWAEHIGGPDAHTRAHAVFGLLNSTPHSNRRGATSTRQTLRAMALAALGVDRDNSLPGADADRARPAVAERGATPR